MSEHKKRGRPAKNQNTLTPMPSLYDTAAMLNFAFPEPPNLGKTMTFKPGSTAVTDMATKDPEATAQAVKAVLKSIYRSGQLGLYRNLTTDYETITKLLKGTA